MHKLTPLFTLFSFVPHEPCCSINRMMARALACSALDITMVISINMSAILVKSLFFLVQEEWEMHCKRAEKHSIKEVT